MGVRIEHPQAMIDAVQYGDAAALLPAADYHLTYTTQKTAVSIPSVCVQAAMW